jgi:hypothetical protein
MKQNEIAGYDTYGNPITNEELIADINLALKQLREETLETYTSEEVREMFLAKFNTQKL